jgi:hypothetical protein
MLVYVGGFVVLFATIGLFAISQSGGGAWALAGAAVAAAAVAVGLAETLTRVGRAVAAGVAATLAIVFAAVNVGAFLDAIGALDGSNDYQPGTHLVEAVVFAGSFLAIRRYRAPLPVLLVALTFWIVVLDVGGRGLGSDGEDVLSLVIGAALAAAGVVVDRAGRRPFGFWLHVVGGLVAGGALVALLGDPGWAIVALLGLGYVALAFLLERSSYAVIGAIGVLVATTMFVTDPVEVAFGLLPFGQSSGADTLEDWQVALSYLVAGLGLAAIGVAGRLWRLPRSGPIAGHE